MSDFGFHNIQPIYEMAFSNNDGIVAKLKWSKGVLSHEGNIDISTELFLELLNQKALTEYNELTHRIHQLENDLTIAKTQNQIYRKALNDNR